MATADAPKYIDLMKDISKNTAGLKKLFGCEEFGVVTYLQYQSGQLFNHQLFPSIAN